MVPVVYTVEYQKRGPPHAHILLFLHNNEKHPIAVEIDKISAEILDLNKEPLVMMLSNNTWSMVLADLLIQEQVV